MQEDVGGRDICGMKIVHIVPGSGDTFYCENCLRDCETVKELRREGEDVCMVPMYLPLFQDNPDLVADAPVFFGGINVYLQQKLALFRRTPRWIDKLFDAEWLLRLVARKSGSTRADALGEMTLSMLKGEDGRQAKEVERLVEWLRSEERPDLIHISNALLLGLAEALKEGLDVPIVCSLQDEDTWIDAMDDLHRQLCWEAISERAEFVDVFIAVSGYYADEMRKRLGISEGKVRIVPVGTDAASFQTSALPLDPPVIGFLARMSESQGLGNLVDAFILLKKNSSFSNAILRICGGATGDDRDFIALQKKKLSDAGIRDDVEFLEDFKRAERVRFLQSLTVMSVPVAQGSAFGSYLLESMASGVPVVQPNIGSFPEIVGDTGGGVLYSPSTPERLAAELAQLLGNPEKLHSLARAGQTAVRERYSVERMASGLLDVYTDLR